MRVNLTARFAKSATTEGRKSPIFYDDEVIGFGLQVRDNGRKTFSLDYTFEGRRRRYFIGDHPAWSVQAPRDEAKRLKREVDAGRDPESATTNAGPPRPSLTSPSATSTSTSPNRRPTGRQDGSPDS